MIKIEQIIFYLLLVRTKCTVWLRYLYRTVCDTKEVTYIGDFTNKPFSIFWRYFLVRTFGYMIGSLKSLQNSVDIKSKKIQIVKDYEDGEKTMILDADKLGKESVTLVDMIEHIDNKSKIQDTGKKPIFLKFELDSPQHGQICLKKFVSQYRDSDKHHHHTLQNILQFNNIDIPIKDAVIRIIKMEKGKRNILELSYDDVNNQHISYFFDLDKTA